MALNGVGFVKRNGHAIAWQDIGSDKSNFNYIFDNKMLKFYHKRCTQTTQFNFQREFFILLKFLIAFTLFLMEIGMLLKKC